MALKAEGDRFMKTFLFEERIRLKLKSKDIAAFTGIANQTQSNYELGKRSPDAQYLSKLTELGFDIRYVLTGLREELVLTPQEKHYWRYFDIRLQKSKIIFWVDS